MNTSIVGKQFDLTEPIKAYIEGAVDTLGKYNLDIISVRTVISADEKNGKKGFNVEFAINMAHKNTVVIQQKDKDVYAAIDLAIYFAAFAAFFLAAAFRAYSLRFSICSGVSCFFGFCFCCLEDMPFSAFDIRFFRFCRSFSTEAVST